MKKFLLAFIAAFTLAGGVHAASGGIAWDKAPNKLSDNVALQNGARLFVNYCLNCHSASYMRFNRLTDIGLTEQQIKDNLLVGTDKVGETMKAAVDPKQAKEWFGANPPDLSVIARSRSGHGGTGADYLFTYMRTFYRDENKATGWNNLAFPNVGMPHVLWEMQGERRPIWEKGMAHGQPADIFRGWEQVSAGSMSTVQYDQAVGDLVAYMQWMSEPSQNLRIKIGVLVLIFLGFFTVFTWRLNAAYWKDVK